MNWLTLASPAFLVIASCASSPLATDGGAPADLATPSDLARTAPDLVVAPDLGRITCGGFGGAVCPGGMFCEMPPGQCCCDRQGTCAPLPAGCTKQYDPVCGCDGKTYGNDCVRQAAGVAPDHHGPCDFRCGNTTCRLAQLCVQGCCGAQGCMPPPPACKDAPVGCGPQPTCACIPKSPGSQCQDLPGGGVMITEFGCP